MNQFVGKYTLHAEGMPVQTVCLRNYYDGTLHGMLEDGCGAYHLLRDVVVDGTGVSFTLLAGQKQQVWSLTLMENSVSGTVETTMDGATVSVAVSGEKTELSDEDDGIARSEMKKKALIIYASLTGNTAKVANWFRETFEHYGMEVTMLKISNKTKWERYEGKLYIEDYDVVCMGSLIIGGAPTTQFVRTFSAGALGALEEGVAQNAEAGLKFNAGGAGGPVGSAVKDAPPPPPSDDPVMRLMRMWHRPDYPHSYPGGPDPHGIHYPIGIAFTTYGGGFKGSDEALPVLETMKLYLEAKGTKVIGKFACCGKEFGPAGLDDGELPMGVSEPPVFYKDSDGNYHAGGFFWHCHANSKPGPREEFRAKAFIADIVEDHFYTADGKRRELGSQYISLV